MTVTGAMNEEMTVAVLVSKNGSTDAETVLLEQKNGTFEGVYENVDQAGTYLLETQIREGDTVITSNTATISVCNCRREKRYDI